MIFLLCLQLLVAEVQSLMGDGTMSLHTRSLRYGKVNHLPLLRLLLFLPFPERPASF